MQFDHSFTVPVGVDEAWELLLDVERSGPCLPGAVIESVEDDRVTGSVKVKLGPLNLAYSGAATLIERNRSARRIVLDATGLDARTDSRATMKVTVLVSGSGANTDVQLHTELDVTGKPAQFGRTVMDDVGTRMVAQFADRLARVLDGTAVPAKSARKPATRKSAAKKTAMKKAASAKTAKKTPVKKAATNKTATKTAAPKKATPPVTASTTAAARGADAETEQTQIDAAPPFAATTGTPSAPTFEDQPSVNGHTGGGPGPSAAQHGAETVNPIQVTLPTLVKRAAPVLGPAAVGLIIVLAVRRRRRGNERR